MSNKLMELLEKEIVTLEELEEIQEHEDVVEVQNCGTSGKYINCTWFNVITIDDKEYSVYVDNREE